jgi:hypothetical protein
MPGLNKKGPAGDGPMTGRKRGVCTGEAPDLGNKAGAAPVCGRGFGRGLGRGSGRGRFGGRFFQSRGDATAGDAGRFGGEMDRVKSSIDSIAKRLTDLEKTTSQKKEKNDR